MTLQRKLGEFPEHKAQAGEVIGPRARIVRRKTWWHGSGAPTSEGGVGVVRGAMR